MRDVTEIVRGMAAESPIATATLDRLDSDLNVEASNLVLAVLEVDGRLTDEELWAYLRVFGPRFDTQLELATPNDVRTAGLARGKKAWLDSPSGLFDLIMASDRAHGTAHARTYYDRATELAFIVCSLDEVTSTDELRAVEQWRGLLVSALRESTTAVPGSGRGVRPGASGTAAGEAVVGASLAVTPAPAASPEPPARLDDLLAELDALVGLAGVKAEVALVTNLLRVQKLRKDRGLATVDSSHHLVFTGNPGTGKTTVARLLAKIYRSLGLAERGHLVETDRAGLVAGFVGQTALKVTAVFDSAMGGVLLVDEAYALARGGERDFGREAIDTIVKLIEDRRDDVVVIAAGYPLEMAEFIDANPGLRSRFPKTIAFEDYTNEELSKIFASLCAKNQYHPSPEAADNVSAFFTAQTRGKGFGNGRLARNLFEQVIANQATRLVGRVPRATEPAAPGAPASSPEPWPEPTSERASEPTSEPTDDQLLTLEAADIPSPDDPTVDAGPGMVTPLSSHGQ